MRFTPAIAALVLALSAGSPALAIPSSAHPIGHDASSNNPEGFGDGRQLGVSADAGIGNSGSATHAEAGIHRGPIPPEVAHKHDHGKLEKIPLVSDLLDTLGDLLGIDVEVGGSLGPSEDQLSADAYWCIECTCYGASAGTGLGSTGQGDVDAHAGVGLQMWADPKVCQPESILNIAPPPLSPPFYLSNRLWCVCFCVALERHARMEEP